MEDNQKGPEKEKEDQKQEEIRQLFRWSRLQASDNEEDGGGKDEEMSLSRVEVVFFFFFFNSNLSLLPIVPLRKL